MLLSSADPQAQSLPLSEKSGFIETDCVASDEAVKSCQGYIWKEMKSSAHARAHTCSVSCLVMVGRGKERPADYTELVFE